MSSLLDFVGQLSLFCIMSTREAPPRVDVIDEPVLLVEVRGEVVTVDGYRVPTVEDLGPTLAKKKPYMREPVVVLAFDQDAPARTVKRVMQIAVADGFSTIEFLS